MRDMISECTENWDECEPSGLTEAEYLNRVLGPKYLPLELVIPLTIVYVVIFITGIFGNVATCTVIIQNASMRTTTNYYLFSLAISDLTLLVLGLPNELSVFWQQYPWVMGAELCKIRAYVSEMSSYVSVLTIMAFSIERYLAICHPLRVYSMSGLKRSTCFILAAWSIAIVSAIPFAIYTIVHFVEYPPGSGNFSTDSAICAMLLSNMPNYPLHELSCVLFFLIPMLVILILYTRIGLKIKRSTKDAFDKMQGTIHGNYRQIESRKSVIKMLSAVVVMFFLCWAPFHAQRLLYIYAQDFPHYVDLNEWLYIFSGCLYYFNSTVNPILYNLMSMKYRKAFKRTLCRRNKKSASRPLNEELNRACNREITCSVRYTIAQAKEIFCFTSSSEEIIKNNKQKHGRITSFSQNTCLLQRENLSSEPVFVRQHFLAYPQLSNESTASTRRSEDTVSITRSSL